MVLLEAKNIPALIRLGHTSVFPRVFMVPVLRTVIVPVLVTKPSKLIVVLVIVIFPFHVAPFIVRILEPSDIASVVLDVINPDGRLIIAPPTVFDSVILELEKL